VEDKSGKYDAGVSDSFVVKYLLLLNPKGGDSYTVGQTVPISWRATPDVSSVGIGLSIDGGKSSFQDITKGSLAYPQITSYQWVIGSEENGSFTYGATNSCVINVYSYTAKTEIFDKNAATFTIVGP
jgi:hypothetical protein